GTNDPAGRAAAFGMPASEVDGSDFFAVEQAAREAIERARDGGGPSTVVAEMPRYYGHFEGDPQLYRAAGEVEALRENRDCLKLFRARVTEAGLLDEADLDSVDAEIKALIEGAVETARAAPMPDPAELEKDVYVSY
ncbi:MAG: thiamine pyrophosphate-dependent enzyme, partial [Pseudomonadota bacterium]